MQLGGNELFRAVVETVDDAKLFLFSSDQVALRMRDFRRVYLMKNLTRLRQRGLLGRVKVTRWVRGGYRRGVRNLYYITARGRKRVEWLKSRGAWLGFRYLATGTGRANELLLQAMAQNLCSSFSVLSVQGSSLPAAGRGSVFMALACSGADAGWHLLSAGLKDPLPTILTLQKNGLLPPSVLYDPAIFLTVAKTCYKSSDAQILTALLYRTAVYWRKQFQATSDQLRSVEFKTLHSREDPSNSIDRAIRLVAHDYERRIEYLQIQFNIEKAGLRMKLCNEEIDFLRVRV